MKYRSGGQDYEGSDAGAKRLDDGSWLVAGRRIWVARTAAGIEAWCGGKTWRLERAESTRSKSSKKEADITSPMTGKITKVLVKEGAVVEAGQVVVIVEAMKMEYRVTAPLAGRVTKVTVAAGSLVEMGQVLVDVKSANGA